jgi:hypothetical protein
VDAEVSVATGLVHQRRMACDLALLVDDELGDKKLPSGYVKIAIENGHL